MRYISWFIEIATVAMFFLTGAVIFKFYNLDMDLPSKTFTSTDFFTLLISVFTCFITIFVFISIYLNNKQLEKSKEEIETIKNEIEEKIIKFEKDFSSSKMDLLNSNKEIIENAKDLILDFLTKETSEIKTKVILHAESNSQIEKKEILNVLYNIDSDLNKLIREIKFLN